ncbi:MAG TPA: C39 family peptidase [Candidatus Eisenbacteria bacterium]|nr:C39 family peptidase [Candidatus Eisenbacteria bacterium]
MKKIIFVIFLTISVFFFHPQLSFANQIFQENFTGTMGQSWNPSFFILQNSNNLIYNLNGVIDATTNDAFYTYQTTVLDSTIKWSVILNGNYGGIVSCRNSNNFASEERVIFSSDGTAQFNWYHNGGGSASSKVNIGTTGLHNFELDCTGNSMILKEDGSTILTTNTNWDITQQMQMIRLDMFDNTTTLTSYQYCESSGCSSITPTPTPIQLNVPLVKQTSNPWQAFEYDTAHVWAPLAKTIHDWGCALTSAVMILQYNGIVNMPDNTLLDPGTLNTWLKSQPDGYVGNGLVNWIAIQRFTRLVRLAFNNPSFLYDALVYRRSTNPTQLTSDLVNNMPDILEEPGHFVVAKGTQGNTFTINDPYFSRNTLNDGYNNTFLSFVRFIPSHTDLSYILITSDPSLTLTVRNSLNQSVGTSFIQQPLINDSDSSSSGSPLTMFYLEQPTDGLYTLTATTSGQNQPYSLNEYLYDLNGNVTVSSASGTTDNNGQVTLPIVFKKTTFQSLLTDLQNAFDLKLVPEGVYNALGSQIRNIQKEIERGQVNVAKFHLSVISLLLNVVPGVTTEAKTLLQSDIATLSQGL